MEINSFIFPAPKCQYNEKTFKEMIWIPIFDQQIQKRKSSQLCTRVLYKFIKMTNHQNLKSQPDVDPLQDISNSHYDQEVDEVIARNKSPKKIMNNYQSNQNSCITKNNITSHVSQLYSSVAKIAGYRRSESQKSLAHNLQPKQIKQTILRKIPCIYINNAAQYTLLYFHANGEDLYTSYDLMWHMGDQLKVNVIGIEYPGYGIYKADSNEQAILDDADHLVNYLTQHKNIPLNKLIFCGRSIGTGPACHLASQYKPALLILISPFLSIKQLVAHRFGNLFSQIVKERFPNFEKMEKIFCPIFVLHGQADQTVPYSHSSMLIKNCRNHCKLVSPKHMTHATFNFKLDLIKPLQKFMKQNLIIQ